MSTNFKIGGLSNLKFFEFLILIYKLLQILMIFNSKKYCKEHELFKHKYNCNSTVGKIIECV